MTNDGKRVCFTMRLRPEKVDAYLEAHRTVWPEMLDALRRAGWHDYTLFVDRDNAQVVGYLTTGDFDRAQSEMAKQPVNERWQAHMAEYFEPASGPDSSLRRLDEYFHTD